MSEEVIQKVVTEPTNEAPKKTKKKSKVAKIIEWVILGIFGVIFGLFAISTVTGMVQAKDHHDQVLRFGFGNFIVLTNSMEPEIPKDAAIVTYMEDIKSFPDRLAKGETIDVTFFNENTGIEIEPDAPEFVKGGDIYTDLVMTHRLREVHIREDVEFGQGRYVCIASGTNTGGEHSLEGQYQIFTETQYLGTVKIANAFLGGIFNFVASPWGLIILLIIPAGYLIISFGIDIFKELKKSEQEPQVVVGSGDSRLSGMSEADKARLKQELLDEMINSKKKEGEDK